MKLFFKKKLVDQILDAIHKAALEDREIDYVELTKAEACKLCREYQKLSHLNSRLCNPCHRTPTPRSWACGALYGATITVDFSTCK